MPTWLEVPKNDPDALALADRHYSRRKPGSPGFMPPGQTLVLLTPDTRAVFGWWRPHPEAHLPAANGLDAWTCTIFRNEGPQLSSVLILAAEAALAARYPLDPGPDGLVTYVWDERVASPNPGYCFKRAGWTTRGRSADGRKTLLHKPFPTSPARRLTPAERVQVLGELARGTSAAQIAREFGISKQAVSRLGRENNIPARRGRLTEEQIDEIRARARTTTYAELASEFGVTAATIGRVVRRESWG